MSAAARLRAPALPDLLNWAAVVDDGVVLQKDGSLLAGWRYSGPDLATATAAVREQAAAVVNAALAPLGADWMLHVDAGRAAAGGYPPPEASAFPDAATAMIDAERRAHFEAEGGHFQSSHVLTVTWLPPKTPRAKAVDLIFEDGGEGPGRGAGEAAVAHFAAAVAELEDRLAPVLALERLGGMPYRDAHGAGHVRDGLLGHLRWTLTGEQAPVNLPPVPMYLDAVIGAQDFWTGVIPKVGERYVMCVAIDGFPLETHQGILAELDQLPVAHRWSTRFICEDPHRAQAHLRGYRRRWQQRMRGFVDQVVNRAPSASSPVNADAAAMVGEADAALAESSSGLVAYGAYTSVVVLMDANRQRLEAAARHVRQALLALGFGARIETVNCVEAFLGSLPGHAAPNIRRPLLHTLHLANLLPLSSVWPGDAEAPCPMYPAGSPALIHAATGSTPFGFNLHVGDVGHALMFGPTGSGKSTALALVAAQFRRYAGATVYAFDKGNSMEVLTRAAGGVHFDVAAREGGLCFAPLAVLDQPGEIAWAADWVETLLALQGASPAPSQRNELNRALQSLAAQGERTLTALEIEIQDAALKSSLQPYTVSGPYGQLLDAASDDLALGDWACFEVGELMNLDDRVKLPVLLYLFRAVERRCAGQPCLIVLDEAWTMLGHAAFRDRIREWLKTLRKNNAAVVLATQSLSDASRSGILDVLAESCPTKVFLANPEAEQADAAALYRALGLHDAEIAAVRGLTPKREYYVRGAGRRVIDFALGPVALSFVGAAGREDRRRVRELERLHGADWPRHWLEERNVA